MSEEGFNNCLIESFKLTESPVHLIRFYVSGEFFAADCDQQYNDLIYGSLRLPSIPIYILGTSDPTLTKYYKSQDSSGDYESGFELIDGITYLGRKGILTSSSGLKIAYLSGKQTNDQKNDDKNTFDIKDYESLLLSHQSSSGCH